MLDLRIYYRKPLQKKKPALRGEKPLTQQEIPSLWLLFRGV